jgi:hypothetical protein
MKLLILLILIIFICGCTFFQPIEENEVLQTETVISACEDLCRAALDSGQYLESGPCLSDAKSDWEPNWDFSNWVCDIAHYPRQAVDNLQENQCQTFKEGKAQHFVELYPNCTLIRAVE